MEDEIREDGEELVYERGYEDAQSGYVLRVSSRPRLFGRWAGEAAFFVNGLDNSGGKLDKAAALLKAGWGAQTFERSGIAGRNAVRKLRMALEVLTGERMKCGCGLDARHRGLCSFRRSLPNFGGKTGRSPNKRRSVQRTGRRIIRRSSGLDVVERQGPFGRRLRESERAANRLQRYMERRAKLAEVARARFEEWMARRAFVRPVKDRKFDFRPEPSTVRTLVLRRVADEKDWRDVLMRRNFEMALPKGSECLLQMDMWHACADPKPSFGVLKRWLREQVDAGVLARVGGGNRRYYVRA